MKLCRGAIVFIDTNAIAAAHSANVWNALRNGFHLVTAEVCAEEATRSNRFNQSLTGKSLPVLAGELETRSVDDVARFRLREVLGTGVALDPGERDLIALARQEGGRVWHLCGPDRATLRALHQLGALDRMVALEELCVVVGAPTHGLTQSMSLQWLADKRLKLALGGSLI